MARVDNFDNFLTDVASAIKEKKKTTEPINASEFDNEIRSIETGITPTGTINIIENGTHDVANYANANVEVPAKTLTTKSITSNGLYKATDDGFDGYSEVSVETSGVDINDYFETTLTNNNKSNFGKLNFSKKVPKVNIASDVTDMLNAFAYYGLTVAPDMDLSNVVNLAYLFSYSNSLKYAPTYDLSSCIQASGFFASCSELLSFNFINTSKVKYMSSMFANTKIKELCFMDTSNVIEMDFMCTNCKQLLEFPSFDTSKVTSMRSILSGCSSLIRVGNIDTSNVTNMNSAFQNCPKLITIPKLNASKATNIANVVNTNTSLRDFGGLENLGQAYLTTDSANYSNYTLTVQYCKNLTHDSLMNVINNLYDIASLGVQTQKLILGSTNLAKLSEEEIAIATNKGWSVS